MKNILVKFASHEMNQVTLITDIEKLSDTNIDQKNAKDAIKYTLCGGSPSKSFGHFYCDDMGILDEGGYLLHNTLYDVFGFTSVPYTVEHEVEVRCDI
jgi:hypothetical protein